MSKDYTNCSSCKMFCNRLDVFLIWRVVVKYEFLPILHQNSGTQRGFYGTPLSLKVRDINLGLSVRSSVCLSLCLWVTHSFLSYISKCFWAFEKNVYIINFYNLNKPSFFCNQFPNGLKKTG